MLDGKFATRSYIRKKSSRESVTRKLVSGCLKAKHGIIKFFNDLFLSLGRNWLTKEFHAAFLENLTPFLAKKTDKKNIIYSLDKLPDYLNQDFNAEIRKPFYNKRISMKSDFATFGIDYDYRLIYLPNFGYLPFYRSRRFNEINPQENNWQLCPIPKSCLYRDPKTGYLKSSIRKLSCDDELFNVVLNDGRVVSALGYKKGENKDKSILILEGWGKLWRGPSLFLAHGVGTTVDTTSFISPRTHGELRIIREQHPGQQAKRVSKHTMGVGVTTHFEITLSQVVLDIEDFATRAAFLRELDAFTSTYNVTDVHAPNYCPHTKFYSRVLNKWVPIFDESGTVISGHDPWIVQEFYDGRYSRVLAACATASTIMTMDHHGLVTTDRKDFDIKGGNLLAIHYDIGDDPNKTGRLFPAYERKTHEFDIYQYDPYGRAINILPAEQSFIETTGLISNEPDGSNDSIGCILKTEAVVNGHVCILRKHINDKAWTVTPHTGTTHDINGKHIILRINPMTGNKELLGEDGYYRPLIRVLYKPECKYPIRYNNYSSEINHIPEADDPLFKSIKLDTNPYTGRIHITAITHDGYTVKLVLHFSDGFHLKKLSKEENTTVKMNGLACFELVNKKELQQQLAYNSVNNIPCPTLTKLIERFSQKDDTKRGIDNQFLKLSNATDVKLVNGANNRFKRLNIPVDALGNNAEWSFDLYNPYNEFIARSAQDKGSLAPAVLTPNPVPMASPYVEPTFGASFIPPPPSRPEPYQHWVAPPAPDQPYADYHERASRARATCGSAR